MKLSEIIETQSLPEREKRLPSWTRQLLADLRREIAQLRKTLRGWEAPPPPPPTIVFRRYDDREYAYSSIPEGATFVFDLGKDRKVRAKVTGEGEIELHAEDGYLTVYGNSSNVLYVSPLTREEYRSLVVARRKGFQDGKGD